MIRATLIIATVAFALIAGHTITKAMANHVHMMQESW